jgi:hypothetical protein
VTVTRLELQILVVFLCFLVIVRSVGDAVLSDSDVVVPFTVIVAMAGMISVAVRPDRTEREPGRAPRPRFHDRTTARRDERDV